MSTYLISIVLIMAIGLVGIAVDRLYRAFARKNPQLGPFRDSGKCGSCSGGSGCSGSKDCAS